MQSTVSLTHSTDDKSTEMSEGELINPDDDKDDENYLAMLESFTKQANQNGEDLIHDNAPCVHARRKLAKLLHSFTCNVVVISLASLDAIILMCVLLLEIEALKLAPGHKQTSIQNARFGLECVSIGIISLFMIEISLKLFAVGPKHFCSHWIEVVDAFVTLISLMVDALVIADHVKHFSHHSESDSGALDAFGAAAGLVIVFRLWRIIRILNATMVTMSTGLSNKIKKINAKQICLQRRIYQLERKLIKHHIPLPDDLEELEPSELTNHRRPFHSGNLKKEENFDKKHGSV